MPPEADQERRGEALGGVGVELGNAQASRGWVKALLHSVYDQPDAAAVHAQFDRVLDALAASSPPSRSSLTPRWLIARLR